MLRLTWQMSPKNKLGAYYDRLYKTRGHDMLAGTDPATASFIWRSPVYYTTQIKWTSTVSSKLLLEAGYGSNVNVTVQNMQDGIEQERGTPAWYAGAARLDRDLGMSWAAPNNIPTFVPTKYYLTIAASYVTGSHTIKAGLQYGTGSRRGRTPGGSRTGLPDRRARLGRHSQYAVPLPGHDEPRPRVLRAGFLDVQAADA